MKEYPYIGKGLLSGSTYLVVSARDGYIIESEYGVFGERCDMLNTVDMEDITKEYLNGKCIKVESPEHSEYIQKMAFRYGWSWCFCVKGVSHTDKPYLYFYSDHDISHHNQKVSGWEEIFIPLPTVEQPVSEPEWKVGDEVCLRDKHYSTGIACTGKILYLSDDIVIVGDNSGNEVHWWRSEYDIITPLTDEEKFKLEVRELLEQVISEANVVDEIVDILLERFDVSEKPL